jgi:hypothetical protein
VDRARRGAAADLHRAIGTGGDPVREKQIMQDLAAVNGGFYASARTVLDTGTLVIGGQVVKLSGVIGDLGIYVDQMTAYVGRNALTCRRATKDAYFCEMSGQSLAKAAVLNGGARAAADAPAEIKSAEREAREAQRGIWRGR